MAIGVYTVHVNMDAEPDADGAIKLVREGFNFWAFLLGTFWALYHRLWVVAGVYLGVSVAMGMLLPPVPANIMQLAVAILIGLEAQDFRRAALTLKGYEEQAVIVAHDSLEAEMRFLQQQGATSSTIPDAGQDSLGSGIA